jgi:integrase
MMLSENLPTVGSQYIIRHKTAAIIGTVTPVPGYPKKLKVYLNNASPYWQAVYWDKGITYRRSLKTLNKVDAFAKAKQFYEHLILAKYQHPAHLKAHVISEVNKPIKTIQADASVAYIASQWIARKAVKWSLRHKLTLERRLQKNILSFIGNKNIQSITRKELLALIQNIEARGANDVARRVLNDCRQIWQYAMVIGLCKQDITVGLNAALHGHVVVHQKAVIIEELPALMRAIKTYHKPGDDITRLALQLMAMTFVRKNELMLATWQEIDLDKAVWKIPAERMKMRVEHVVPLSNHALSILKHIQQHYCSASSSGSLSLSQQLVFHKANKPLVNHALIYALYTMGYKSKMTVHGFRAVASTVLNEQGFRTDVIERQLAHAEGNQVHRAYNRAQYMPERTQMMQWWSDYLNTMAPFTESKTAKKSTIISAIK